MLKGRELLASSSEMILDGVPRLMEKVGYILCPPLASTFCGPIHFNQVLTRRFPKMASHTLNMTIESITLDRISVSPYYL